MEAWKTKSVNAILSVTPRKTDQTSMISFLNAQPRVEPGEAGPSGHSASDKSPSSAKKPKYGPKKKPGPKTPPGLTPSKRDGIVAAIICWTPSEE